MPYDNQSTASGKEKYRMASTQDVYNPYDLFQKL